MRAEPYETDYGANVDRNRGLCFDREEREIRMSKILLVDDDDQFRKILGKTLKLGGYVVLEAPDGKTALERYRQEPADLIITDLIMPEKEGLETIMEFRRLNPAMKIIAISGVGLRNSKLNLVMAQALGARLTLAKPFSQQEILEAVALVLTDAS
jgi:CheY-like chemotaxis protein